MLRVSNFSAEGGANPFHSEAKFSSSMQDQLAVRNLTLKIYNTMGVLVRQEKIVNITSYILHRAGLSEGLYFYELTTVNSELFGSGKFVVD